jgi:hypothetical protein
VLSVTPVLLTLNSADSLEKLTTKNYHSYVHAIAYSLNSLCWKYILLDRLLVLPTQDSLFRTLHRFFGGLALARLGGLFEPLEVEGWNLALDGVALCLQQCIIYTCVTRPYAYYLKLNVLPVSVLILVCCSTGSLRLLGLWSAAYILVSLDIS